jgi:hypothetical protein
VAFNGTNYSGAPAQKTAGRLGALIMAGIGQYRFERYQSKL